MGKRPDELNLNPDGANPTAPAEASAPRQFWRTLDQKLDNEAYQKSLDDEFPYREDIPKIDRRDFMKFVGASTIMAGLAGCRNLPTEEIVPYVKAPEEFVPGKPIYYATSFVHAGYAIGVLAESHMGRPTKVEGNPEHPASLGSADAITLASVYGLYDPDRTQEVQQGKDTSTWDLFFKAIRESIAKDPGGFRILAESITSPSLAKLCADCEVKMPGSKWHHFEPVGGENTHEGAIQAFGEAVQPVYDFSKANIVVSLDSDFLSGLPGSVRYARDFSERRKIDQMNRVYAVDSYPTLVGAMADHRMAMKPSEVEKFARTLAREVGVSTDGGNFEGPPWMGALISDLNANRGSSLVVAGEHQPAEVHALAHAMNSVLGNVGQTVRYVAPMTVGDDLHSNSIRSLIDDMKAGRVSTLLILGGNPVYNTSADLEFAGALKNVAFKAHWGATSDETSAHCDWHVPACHYLEAWGDARAYDGTVSLIQPLIRPLYAGKSAHEVLDGLMDGARKGRDIVRDFWLKERSVDEKAWAAWLEKGFIPNSALPSKSVTLTSQPMTSSRAAESAGIELLFLPDPFLHDGRYANNPWLQELQKPFTSMTWDNTVQLSPRTAASQGLENHDIVDIEINGRKVTGPVWVVPGMADSTAVIHLGFGRTNGGVIAEGPGFNAYAIKPSLFPTYMEGLKLTKVGRSFPLAATHGHHQTEGRDIVRTGTLAELQSNPNMAPEGYHAIDEERNLYRSNDFKYDGYKWAMTIDLNHCIGCNACVTACQSENNIANVGKEQVIRQRELHWIRIDRYYLGDINNPDEIVFQPVACMHCEQAPCEPVCPVAATVHSKEGLNQMVYNRCVGTRYCSNNCPYKVRRFNYINYGDRTDYPSTEDKKRPAPTLRLLQNPDVTVRGRGVMEKCTYCVQRINEARIEAKKHDREIEDGEIVTACQQACPTRAITFGNMADPNSAVSKTRADGRNYLLLEELQTKPRTTYLGKVRNPNPNL